VPYDGAVPPADANAAALAALSGLDAAAQLDHAAARLRGDGGDGPLAALAPGDELAPDPARIDGRLLEAIVARALGGARGAVFTAAPEAGILAAFGLAEAAARRGVPAADALAALLGLAAPGAALARALDGLAVLDPACGGGALLAAAEALARRAGARLRLAGLDVAPLAARAAAARLALAGARAEVRAADAALAPWPAADLVLANPPFLRHERLSPSVKAAAAARSGLPRQADLAAHLAAIAIAHAPVAALVLPRAVATSRSAEPLLAAARARGGFPLWLRSGVAGSFAASVDTVLAVWAAGHAGRAPAEARVPLAALAPAELVGVARGVSTPRLRARAARAEPARGAGRLGDVCRVRFGMKSGANGFFHLAPRGGGRYASALAGEVELAPGDVAPLLATLKEARAPEDAAPARVLFRPAADSASARAYVARGEGLGVHRRPTCAGRSPWWLVAPGRAMAPVLYPAKVGARAFAVLNAAGLAEDKKWHAIFPADGVEPWVVATLLGATPVRLAIDLAARQLTGAQAIADVDCRVLAAAPFPAARALAALAPALAPLRAALARDPVTTDVAATLARPAQRALDLACGEALGLAPAAVERARRDLVARVAGRLAHAAQVRAAVAAGR
jgi:hypothetical protein